MGNPWIRADVGVHEGRIHTVGRLANAKATRSIDASGLALAPGFIDVHSHAGGGLGTEALKHGQPVLAQGITTVLVNPDGGGPIDLVTQRAHLHEAGHRTERRADGAARLDSPRGHGHDRPRSDGAELAQHGRTHT